MLAKENIVNVFYLGNVNRTLACDLKLARLKTQTKKTFSK